jgi:uncharacterized YigZ family protein
MSLRYLAAESVSEEVIKRSRFITRLVPCDNPAEAKALTEKIRKQDHSARHHATALIIGPEAGLERSNDDGEPAGTAGLPMLQALRRAQVTDILAVVTRYFGGTLLGKAGLAAAYGGGVEAALRVGRFLVKRPLAGLAVTVPSADGPRTEHILRQFVARHPAGQLGSPEYAEMASFEIWLPAERVDQLAAALARTPLRATTTTLGNRLVTMAE